MKNISPIIRATISFALLLSTVGCTTNLASVAKALAKDPAFVVVRTPYGSLIRDGRANSGNVVSDTGAVTSTLGANNNLAPSPQPRQQQITPEQFAALVRQQADALLAKEKAEQVTNVSAKVARPRPPRPNKTQNTQTNTNNLP
jgi:hypothetical protein